MRKYLLVLGLFLLFSSRVFGETTVTFNPPTVALGESTELIIETDRPLTQEPDLSAFSGNFAIAGTRQSTHMISVNGHRRTRYRLSFNIFPRKEGQLSTGELKINNQSVPAAVLTVEPAGTSNRLPITFTAKTSQSTVYPDETFLLSIRLSYGVALLDAKIMPPELENATLTPLNMDKTYQEYQDGRPVSVFERTFAVTPDKSGYLNIPPIEVYGLVADNAGRDNLIMGNILFDGLLGGQREVRLETNPVQVTVLEKPENWQGWWLPSTQVSLTSTDNFPEQIKAGDSLTRVIRLSALGTEAEKLPVPKQTVSAGFKIYPSPEQRETIQTPVGDIQGIVNISYILVPTKGGEITIPEVRIPWFNTRTRQAEEAVLPAKTVTVTAEQAVQEEVSPSVPAPKKKASASVKGGEEPSSHTKKSQPTPPQRGHFWGWIIGSFVMALGIGLGLGFLLFRRKKHHSYRITDDHPKSKKKKKAFPDLYPF